MTALMKGASTVGNIFSSNLVLEQEITYHEIVNEGNGFYTIDTPKFWTQIEGTWVVVINVRGIETGYLQEEAIVTVSEKKSVA